MALVPTGPQKLIASSPSRSTYLHGRRIREARKPRIGGRQARAFQRASLETSRLSMTSRCLHFRFDAFFLRSMSDTLFLYCCQANTFHGSRSVLQSDEDTARWITEKGRLSRSVTRLRRRRIWLLGLDSN